MDGKLQPSYKKFGKTSNKVSFKFGDKTRTIMDGVDRNDKRTEGIDFNKKKAQGIVGASARSDFDTGNKHSVIGISVASKDLAYYPDAKESIRQAEG